MDPQFQLMILVVAAGVVIIGIGATLLLMTFRAFARAKRGDIRHIVLLVATILFILLACLALLISSMMFKS